MDFMVGPYDCCCQCCYVHSNYVNQQLPQNNIGFEGDCVIKFLGRFSFEPLKENPLFGPSSSTMASDRCRKKIVRNPPSDIISDLPSNVMETILMFLPLRDAVRTSILSSKWRNKWVNIPKLVFDDTFFRKSTQNHLSRKNRLMMTIYQILLHHQGPILSFTLCVPWLESCSEIDQLILFLSKNGVEEFNLNLRKGEHYRLPSSFFSCLRLRHLNLISCVFKPPLSFKGFSRLTTLHIYQVDLDVDLFGNLISNCPLLERLSVNTSTKFDSLEIYAPVLRYLNFSANFNAIRCKNTPLLDSLLITPNKTERLEYLEEGEKSRMIEVFGCLPVIEELYVGYRFLEFLTLGGVPKRLPCTLNHLKSVQLSGICFCDTAKVSFALCLIKSSPNLEEIVIDEPVGTNPVDGSVLELFEMQDYSDFCLNPLRKVRMWFASGARPELEFIKLLLAKSPMLEMMIIIPHSNEAPEGLRMLKELTRFRRASPNAAIFFG